MSAADHTDARTQASWLETTRRTIQQYPRDNGMWCIDAAYGLLEEIDAREARLVAAEDALGLGQKALGGLIDADLKVIGRALSESQDDETALQALVNVQHYINIARSILAQAADGGVDA